MLNGREMRKLVFGVSRGRLKGAVDDVLAGFKRLAREEDGQAIVELALVLPILLLVLFSIFDFGRAIQIWNSETSLANVGARYAAVGSLPSFGQCNTSESTLTAYLQCLASNSYSISDSTSALPGLQPPSSGGTPVAVCVNVAAGGNTPGQPVTVAVYAKYKWLPVNGLLASTQPVLVGSATMRIENGAGVPSTWVTSASASGCNTTSP